MLIYCRSDEARDNKQEVPPLASGVQGLGLGLPDLKAKKKGKQKASKESHVSDALDKLRAETREAVKGLESVTTAARPPIPDLGNDAMMDDWVKQFEELAGSQVLLYFNHLRLDFLFFSIMLLFNCALFQI